MSYPLQQTSEPYIQTWVGKRFRVNPFHIEDLDIRDIARGLAYTLRFRGMTKRPYSVAEHSVRASHLAASLYLQEHPGDVVGSRAVARWGLMHDASEAYIADLASQVKRRPGLEGYRAAEKELMALICQAFGLPREQPQPVTVADGILVNTEGDQLLPGGRLDPSDGWPAYPAIPSNQGFGWDLDHAESVFLQAFTVLFGSPQEVAP